MSSSPSPAHAHFATEEAKCLVFNFHRPDDFQQIENVLRSPPERAPALLLVGERGIGRRYLLQAAIFRRQQEGARIRYASIDLEGFEPDQHESDFTRYLDHLAAKNQYADNSRWKDITSWIGESKLKLTVRTAALVSVALESSLPVKEIATIFLDSATGVEGPAFRESEAFTRSIIAIAGDSQLVVHVEDLEAAPGILVDWLLRLRNRMPGFYIAFSGSRHAVNPAGAPVQRIELSPLERHEVRSVMDARLSPNQLPDYVCDLLHEYSEGWPCLISAKMADLNSAGLVVADDMWRLSESATEEVLADNLGDGIMDWFRRTAWEASA